MSERTRVAAYWLAEVLVAVAFFMWSTPLGLIYCGIILFMATTRKKITAEELAAAWREYRLAEEGRHGLTDERRRTEQIAYLVLKKLKGRRT